MAATVTGILLTGNHASRPSSGLSAGTLYSCTTHSLVYQTSDTGSTWATWADLTAVGTAPNPTTIELGHASDTTLARVSAGVVSIEGTNIVKAGAITTSGLTQATARLLGRSTASTGAVEEITLGTNLSFSGTTLNAASGGGTFSGARVYNDAGQSLSDNTLTVLTFNTESFDVDGYHEGVTNPGRLTIPSAKDGYFLLIANVDIETASTVQMRIRKNGATYIPGAAVQATGTSAASRTNLSLSILQSAVATDYFEMIGYQNSGGSINAGTGSDPFRCSFEISRQGS